MPPDPPQTSAVTDCTDRSGTDENGDDRFDIVTRADPEAVRDALCRIVSHFISHLPGTEVGTLQIVLAEVLNNISEHAHAGLPPGPVSIRICPVAGALLCRIEDQGHPMPDGVLPPGDLPPLEMEPGDLPEGGFGWHLIRSLTTHLTYMRVAGTNRVEFRLPLRRH